MISFHNHRNISSKDTHIIFLINGIPIKTMTIMDKLVSQVIRNNQNQHGSINIYYIQNGETMYKMLCCNLGDINAMTSRDFVELGSQITLKIQTEKINKIVMHDSEEMEEYENIFLSILEGVCLRNYMFNKFFSSRAKNNQLFLKLIDIHTESLVLQEKIAEQEIIVRATHLTRDLVSTPSNHLTPSHFIQICKSLKDYGVSVTVLSKQELVRLKMNALLAVSKGSEEDPYVAIMQWSGIKSNENNIVLAGKGVTFDSGGINIKPSGRSLSLMKYDMGGAAVVTAVLQSLAERKAPVNVIGIIGIAENMISGKAQRPGDVVYSMSGHTIEVDNTDAEGRMILADILWYAQEKFAPKILIDLATLTGAVQVSLGNHMAGLFSNCDTLSRQISESGQRVGEEVWRLPMSKFYDNLIDSEIADVKNTGRNGAGSITAAQFLQRFIQKECRWAHLDIAGVNWMDTDYCTSPKGATGFGVRLLNKFFKTYYE